MKNFLKHYYFSLLNIYVVKRSSFLTFSIKEKIIKCLKIRKS